MAANRTVRDYSNIRIGSATPDGEVYDHSGVRIGTAGPDGVVRDHAGIRIGAATDDTAEAPEGEEATR